MRSTARKIRNKRLAALSVGVALALAVSACGGGSNAGGGALGSGTTLVVPTNQSPWLDAYKGLVAEYTKETGAKVELRPFPYEQLYSQMVNDIQAGTHSYDVYQFDEPFINRAYDNKWVQPFTSIDPSWKPDPATNSYDNASYWNADKRINDPSGQVMGQPINGNVQLLMYRKDVYGELNLSVPKTWDDAIANGKAAQSAGKTNYGYVLRTQGATGGGAQISYDFLPLLYSYGGNWFRDEGTDWTPVANNSAGVAAATMLRRLAELGPKDTATIGQAQAISAMQAGETAQSQLVAAAAPALESESDSRVVGKVGYSLLPAGLPTDRSEAALKFITWVESKEAQTTFAKLGGIPTRGDVLSDPSIPAEDKAYLDVVQAGNATMKKHVRYTFASDMLPITEKYLSQIAAGTISPQDGMDKLNAELTEVVKKAGYPMSGSK
jgi:multiple sugar transport system substrate-binding protein